MIDTAQGQTRIRAWPRSRGRPKSAAQLEAQNMFRAWQWASKYLSPEMYRQIVEARQGTPILPRDFITAMLAGTLINIRMPDGKVKWSMAARNNISESLDAISQTPGDQLVRGPEYWQGQPAASASGFALLADNTLGAAAAQWESPVLVGITEAILLMLNVTVSISGIRQLQVSQNGGTSYINGASAYGGIDTNGVLSAGTSHALHDTATVAGRYAALHLVLPSGGVGSTLFNVSRGRGVWVNGPTATVNRFRVFNNNGGNLTGGRFIVLGRS